MAQVKKTVIGLTGGIATGKSTVAGMFKKLGCRVVDADEVSHALLQGNTPAYKEVIGKFGRDIAGNDGAIDRRKLAAVVFAAPAKRRQLEAIIHPRVKRLLRRSVAACKRGIVVLEVPLLMEAGFTDLVDTVVVVAAPKAQQLARLARKSGLSRKEGLKRINSQMPLEKKIRLADFVIDNSSTRRATLAQVKKVWEHFARRK